MQYSPKLKKAMEDIKNILKQYDIAGTVVIHEPGFSEYLMQMTPSYSCVSIEDSGAIRIKAKAHELLGGAKERNKKLKDTSNMFKLLQETNIYISDCMTELSEIVDNAVNAEHTSNNHSTNQSQNN
jgi:hypothetical protein